MTFVLDTNIIVYGLDPSDPSKQSLAERLLDAVLVNRRAVPRQVLGELLDIGHKRGGDRLANHRSIVTLIEQATLVVDTDRSSTLTASQIAERYKLQYFDALICAVAQSAGATALVTEDMHDGLRIGSLTIINPFLPGNRERIEELLAA